MTWDVILLASENVYDWQLEKVRGGLSTGAIQAFYAMPKCAVLAPGANTCDATTSGRFYAAPSCSTRRIAKRWKARGELVGTSFHGTATPLIRYRTMDRGVAGRPLAPLAAGNSDCSTRSRAGPNEFIVTRDGRYISMTAINMHDDSFDRIREFPILQEPAGRGWCSSTRRRRS